MLTGRLTKGECPLSRRADIQNIGVGADLDGRFWLKADIDQPVHMQVAALTSTATEINGGYMRLILLAAILLLPPIASAHHSVGTLFDRNETIEVEGELVRVFWRNPHVRFWIKDGDGKSWEIETNALGEMDRYGVTEDLFVVSQIIRAAGYPSRRLDDSFYATNVLLPDGRETLMDPGTTARWSSEAIGFNERVPFAAANVTAAEESANGIFRVWSNSEFQQWTATRTPTAEAARAAWEAPTDDPRLRCIAPGMADAMASPYPIELAQEGDDVIVVRMEEWDGVRRIHMNSPEGAETSPATPMGYSVGRWEGNTLVVSTNRISWPYFDNQGTPQSKAVEIVERFTLSDDERGMTWEAIITDPVNLSEPGVVRQGYEWVPGEEIREFDCTLPG